MGKGENGPVYAIVLTWPDSGVVKLEAPNADSNTNISFLGYTGDVEVQVPTRSLNKRLQSILIDHFIQWTYSSSGIEVTFPAKSKVSSDYAWVLRMENLLSSDKGGCDTLKLYFELSFFCCVFSIWFGFS